MGSLKAADIKAELQHFSKLVRGHVVIDGKAVVETIETIKGILECLHADEVAENPANNRASTMSANQASYQQQSENEYDLIDLDDVYPRSEPRRISSTIERQLDAGLSPPVSTWADICAPVATERIIKIGQIIQPLHNLALRYGAVKPGDRIDIQLSMLLSFASRLCQFNPSTARAFPSSSN
ncbi:uncharacterized protein BDZ99DRAFT_460478 [Mytilinidion resinicola]|uniref:Uncharacterized protein n=1 Tax=Mytilinidion resinicola TaxID=574789 RepID=A0A6A6YW54_9PEZI|nr:uncharacterized protein BDZ99DRAFT_460478 [Mytilinidion resinicola]KAF2813186.1 hypothetical protein BDZ99DRAFT_460478 [Mytilinidion resinicola]